MLPPCRKTLAQKIKRSVMVARVWGNEDVAHPSEGLHPEDFGWTKMDGIYKAVWFEGPPLPESLKTSLHDADDNKEHDTMEDVQQAEWSDSSDDDDDLDLE